MTIESSTGIKALDSLSANEFHVEIDGTTATGIFGVSGIFSRSVDLSAGRLVNPPITITKMVSRTGDPLQPVDGETLANPTTRVTRQVAVVATDEAAKPGAGSSKTPGSATSRSRTSTPSRDALVEERLVIQHHGSRRSGREGKLPQRASARRSGDWALVCRSGQPTWNSATNTRALPASSASPIPVATVTAFSAGARSICLGR